MDSEALRLLQKRRVELMNEIISIRLSIEDQLRPLEAEVDQIERGIKAMTGGKIAPTGADASKSAVAHFARKNNPNYQAMTIKQLVVVALKEHLVSGATANQMLDFFGHRWGRDNISRTSLSPQLSRLKGEGIIQLRGKVWHLVSKENGAPKGAPETREAATSLIENQEDELPLG